MVQYPPPKRTLTGEELELKYKLAGAMSRQSFYYFRTWVRPGLIETWWQRDLAAHLMWFYSEMVAGKRPAMVIMAPPQHGKTEARKELALVARRVRVSSRARWMVDLPASFGPRMTVNPGASPMSKAS